MYLKRLEINGFKSFAAKTTLDLEPGITAIVGPNGSGKSNLADAIRWALGEQSSRHLRLKKSEDLVFAGTAKLPRASLAEVSLLLDNSDGGIDIDFSEVGLSRLLYRSGESEYRVNRSKVKLADVQHLLVSAGFGPNSYSVIGQGTIDSFILATPSERKLLFDEASGIRQYEIRREQSLRKLSSTEANLTRVRDILAELEPRLKSLSRGVAAATERQNLEKQLHAQRQTLIATALQYYPSQISSLTSEQQNLNLTISQRATEIKQLEAERQNASKSASLALEHQSSLRDRLRAVEIERDELSSDLSVKRAELQMLLDRKPEGELEVINTLNADSEVLTKRLEVTRRNLAEARQAEAASNQTLEHIGHQIAFAQTQLNQLRRQIDETSRHEFIIHALSIIKILARGLADKTIDDQQARLLVHKAGRLLSHASHGQAEILNDIKQAQAELNNLMKRRETSHRAFTKIAIKVRSLELDEEHLSLRLNESAQKLSDLRAKTQSEAVNPLNIAQRQKHLATSQQRLDLLVPQIDNLRAELAQQNHKAQNADTIYDSAAKLAAAQSSLSADQTKLSQLSIELAASHQRLDHFKKQSHTWFKDSQPTGKQSSVDIDQLEHEVELTAQKLESHQSADREILAEYEEVESRHKFLSHQLDDLASAEADLKRIISQLEGLIKTKFEAAFKNISHHFTRYFERLFGGGKAALDLRPDGTGVYGIEIKALPPGKKVENLAMLSGGERTLTGIALIAAILKTNPSPFVVMDEVDAALDEANSLLFANILHEISRSAQLIVITHNQQTMQAASVLFGVTMDENHVSRLLSMRLEAARELAAKD